MEKQNNNAESVYVRIPFTTVLTVLSSILLIFIFKTIAPLLMSLLLATLIAVALTPVVRWLETHQTPRWLAILFITVFLIGCMVAFVVMIAPRLLGQISDFVEHIPKLKAELLNYLSASNPVRPFVEKNISKDALLPTDGDYTGIFTAGNIALQGVGQVLLIFVFSIYLLIDGPAVVVWLSAFFSPGTQEKIVQTSHEVSKVISSYVLGQFLSCICAFVYAFSVLWFLNVPNKLLLAVLAGVFDILPVLGFFLSAIPAILFALPISGSTALAVIGMYILYHAIENYFIIPTIYGNRLRVSTFVILLSLIAAFMLAGIPGAIAILPVVASYPIVERIWLKKILGTDTVAEHAHPGSTT
jgi:predicted PurR-regulated permease PerM